MISGAVSLNYLMIMGGISDSLSPRSLLAHPLLKRSTRGGNSRANEPFAPFVYVHVNSLCFCSEKRPTAWALMCVREQKGKDRWIHHSPVIWFDRIWRCAGIEIARGRACVCVCVSVCSYDCSLLEFSSYHFVRKYKQANHANVPTDTHTHTY